MDLNQVIYTVFHAEFESGSKIGPKPPQDPIFNDFLKIMVFMHYESILGALILGMGVCWDRDGLKKAGFLEIMYFWFDIDEYQEAFNI